MNWKKTTILLCFYGAIKEFRPATPFLTPFLTSEKKNLTLDQVYSQIYPYWTYSYMIALIPMFILTDILRYKPIIIIESIGLVLTWSLLVFGQGIQQMQFMQITFGISSAAEIAYYSYVYSIVNKKHYKKATSYVRTAALVGKLIAFALGQILISFHVSNYLTLNQISLGAVSVVTLISFFLPKVKPETTKITGIEDQNVNFIKNGENEVNYSTKQYFVQTRKEIQLYSKNQELLKWSIWWALASCGIYQVQNYMQSLWKDMQNDSDDVENGIVDFLNTFFGAILSFLIQYLSIDWTYYGQPILTTTSFLISILLFVCSKTTNIFISYSSYIIISSIYHMLITAASANVAKEVSSYNQGLIFGCNTFFAVILQSLLTLVVVDSRFLHLNIRTQFTVYSGYFGFVASIFLVYWVYSKRISKQQSEIINENIDE